MGLCRSPIKVIMNKHILSKLRKRTIAEMELTATVRRVQKQCQHTQQAECDYLPSEFGDSHPPARICLNCGLVEEGWGCGYTVLKNNPETVGHISRDRLYTLRCGAIIDAELKGPLLRGQCSLYDIIDGNGKRDERDW